MTSHKPWQPKAILISNEEVTDSIIYANYMGWSFCPSPVNAAFIVMLALLKVQDEN